MQIGSPKDSRPPTSPSENKKTRGHNPRGSLDFKMRILTKKKVVVPTTALNNFNGGVSDSARQGDSGSQSKMIARTDS